MFYNYNIGNIQNLLNVNSIKDKIFYKYYLKKLLIHILKFNWKKTKILLFMRF
jgi:hypothetical protein